VFKKSLTGPTLLEMSGNDLLGLSLLLIRVQAARAPERESLALPTV
jgi:hypothetical protein